MSPRGIGSPLVVRAGDTARRTEVVSGFSAVELQSHDPQSMAQRWADIAGMPLRQDDQGRLSFPLENADVRFVEATDGRGDGLGGVDLVVADVQGLLTRAEQRGCRVSDDHR